VARFATVLRVIPRSEALLLGGRSGVGKSSIGNEIHLQLSTAGIWHCLIEGDNLDLAYPPPWEHGLAERNLAAIRTQRHRCTPT
jgi:adenylylsulfate kinase-like enzyme